MTWQDELQHLDSEYAAGRLSAEDYRQRRDEVLDRVQSGRGAARQDPFPPAFNWNETATRKQIGPQDSGTDANSEQATEFVQNPLLSEAPEQTSIQSGTRTAGSGPEQAGTREQSAGQASAGSDPDSEPTRFVSFDSINQASQQSAGQPPPGQPPTGQQSSGQQSSGQQSSGQAGSTQRSPPSASNAPSWQSSGVTPGPSGAPDRNVAPDRGITERRGPTRMQGPEVFETARGSSRGTVIGGIVLGSVLIVGAVAGAGVYLTQSSDESASNDPGTTQQPPAAPEPPQQPPPQAQPPAIQPPAIQPPEEATPEPALPEPPAVKPPPASSQEMLVAPPPGPPHPFNGPVDRPALEGPKASVLSPGMRDFALQHGMIDGWYNGTDATMPKTTLLAIRMPDENTAFGLVNAYAGEQAGLTSVPELSCRGAEVRATGTGTFRTAYVAHGWAIIVDVAGDPSPGVKDQFKAVLDQQIAQSPPTIRR